MAAAGVDAITEPEPEPTASEQAIAGAVADVDAPPPRELREDQIENAVSFLAHPKVQPLFCTAHVPDRHHNRKHSTRYAPGRTCLCFAQAAWMCSGTIMLRCKLDSPVMGLLALTAMCEFMEQVRGSTVASKRSFLERKGLTSDEIDEAFRRVPEAPAPAPTESGQPRSS